MKVTTDEARAFFEHPSQRIMGMRPDMLPEEGMEYRAVGPVLWVFHGLPWPGLWMGHIAVKPEAWGHVADLSMPILRNFWNEKGAARICAWLPQSNRAAHACARRIGFVVDGVIPLPDPLIELGWTP